VGASGTVLRHPLAQEKAVRLRIEFILAIIVLLTATGCSASQRTRAEKQPVLLSKKEVMNEYNHETRQLELPPKAQWNANEARAVIGIDHYAGDSMMYEEGIGSQTAQFEWYCAWAHVALDENHARADALAHLATFNSLSVWNNMDDVGHAMFLRINDRALAGDLQPLSEYVDRSCHAGGSA
jgi:hypothetical protein